MQLAGIVSRECCHDGKNYPLLLRLGRTQMRVSVPQTAIALPHFSYFIDSSGFVLLDMGANTLAEVTTTVRCR